jgi:hypothetical protein
MRDWWQELWYDLTDRTILYPVEAAVVCLCWLCMQIPWVAGLRVPQATSWFHRVANHRKSAIIAVFGLALAGSMLDREPFPPPGVHDEFSYLLAGETFALGRLTNPPHPMRRFFESFHTIQEPTYMSMYPPGQGLAIALGIVLTGDPAWGIRIAAAAMTGALCWMLQAWVTPTWALVGALIAAVRIGWFSYWAHSFWGGAVPALGGALLLGAAGRILKRSSRAGVRNGALLALGVLILVNSRLFEGSIAALCVLLWLGWTGFRGDRSALKKWAAAAGCLLVAGGCWMAYYNWRITGDALRPPYLHNRSKYQIHGSFFWEKPASGRTYAFAEMERFYRESEGYTGKLGFWRIQADKPKRAWHFFVGPALTLAALGLWGIWKTQLTLPAGMLLVFFASHLLVRWHIQPHYAGPVAGAGYVILVQALRRMRAWNRKRWLNGRSLTRACVAACVVMAVVRLLAPALGIKVFQEFTHPWYSYGLLANFHRQKVEQALKGQPGRHLVLVQYNPNHRPDIEWVYNHADVDNARIVWARYIPGRDAMQPLLNYYRDRRIWWMNPDADPTRVVDYRDILQGASK